MPGRCYAVSDVESEQNDVAVLHNVVFAFGADFAFFASGGEAAAFEKYLVVDDFRADKPALEIGMYLAGGLRGFSACFYGPGARFGFAGGQKAHEPEKLIRSFDKSCQAAFF